jgi:hypothetical protein
MADRYWVGGSGTWDSVSTGNWSATSGGAPGASAPTSVDSVFFNASSGSPNVSISGATCLDWNHTAGNATFDFGFSSVNVHGSLTWSAGTTLFNGGTLFFAATSGARTVNTAAKALFNTSVIFGTATSTATWTLQSNLIGGTFSSITVNSGTFTTFNGTTHFSVTEFDSITATSIYTAATVNFNSSTIGSAAIPTTLNFTGTVGSLLTVGLGSSTIYVYSATFTENSPFGPSFGLTVTSAGGSIIGGTGVNASFTALGTSQCAFRALTDMRSVFLTSYSGTMTATTISLRSVTADPATLQFGQTGGTVGITSVSNSGTASSRAEVFLAGSFTCSSTINLGNGVGNPSLVTSQPGVGASGTVTGLITANEVRLLDVSSGTITFTGGITFPAGTAITPVVEFARSGTGSIVTGNINTTTLLLNSLGNIQVGACTSSAIGVPTVEKTVVSSNTITATSFAVGAGAFPFRFYFFTDPASFTSGAMTIANDSIIRVSSNLTLTGTLTVTSTSDDGDLTLISAGNMALTSVTLVSGPIVPFGSSRIFTLQCAGTTTITGALSGQDGYLFDLTGNGGTVSLGTTASFSGIRSFGATTLALNACAITIGGGANSDPYRYFEVQGPVTSGASSLTFANPVTATAITESKATFNVYDSLAASQTFGSITVQSGITNFYVYIQDTVTCTTFTRTGNANRYSMVELQGSGTLVCTTSVNLSGNSLINRLYVYTTYDNSTFTISAPARTLVNVDLRNITAAGGSLPWGAGTSVGDAQGNANITFTPAVIRYAVASGDWESTAIWSASSGGAPGATIPLPQDDVQLNSGSGAITVTTGQRRFLGRNIFIANFTGTLSFNAVGISNSSAVFGNFLKTDTLGTITVASGRALNLMAKSLCSVEVRQNLSNLSIQLMSPGTANIDLFNYSVGNIYPRNGTINLSSSGSSINIVNLGSSTVTIPEVYAPGQSSSGVINLGSSLLSIGNLNTTSVGSYDVAINGGSSNVTLTKTTGGVTDFSWRSGTLYNVDIANSAAATTDFATIRIQSGSGITGNFTSSGSSSPFRLGSSAAEGFTLSGSARLLLGSKSAPVLIDGITITDDTSIAQETYDVYYVDTSVVGTNTNSLRAFGASNIVGNTGDIVFPSPLKVAAWTSGSHTWSLPNDFGGSFYLVSYGGGAQGGYTGSGATGGGGSGALSINCGLSALRGQTVYVSVSNSTTKKTSTSPALSTSGGNTWINVSSNSQPTLINTGVFAVGGSGTSGNSGGVGGTAASCLGVAKYNGGNGGTGIGSGGGGGAAPYNDLVGFAGGSNSGVSTFSGGAGGGGLTSAGGGEIYTGSGANGGNPTGGLGGALPNNPGANSLSGGGGGGGGSGTGPSIIASGSITRTAGTNVVTCTFSSPQAGLAAGSFFVESLTFTNATGNYSRSGTLVTCTYANHGLTNGQIFVFRVVTGAVLTGTYTATVLNTNQFTFTSGSGTTSGQFAIGNDVNNTTNQTLTAVSSSVFTYTSNSNTYKPSGTFNILYRPNVYVQQSGGNGSNSSIWNYNYLNGVSSSGSTGPGGGGGGTGSGAGVNLTSAGDGGIAAGGGGTGNNSSASGQGGSGGAGLAVLVYAVGIEDASSQIIG